MADDVAPGPRFEDDENAQIVLLQAPVVLSDISDDEDENEGEEEVDGEDEDDGEKSSQIMVELEHIHSLGVNGLTDEEIQRRRFRTAAGREMIVVYAGKQTHTMNRRLRMRQNKLKVTAFENALGQRHTYVNESVNAQGMVTRRHHFRNLVVKKTPGNKSNSKKNADANEAVYIADRLIMSNLLGVVHVCNHDTHVAIDPYPTNVVWAQVGRLQQCEPVPDPPRDPRQLIKAWEIKGDGNGIEVKTGADASWPPNPNNDPALVVHPNNFLICFNGAPAYSVNIDLLNPLTAERETFFESQNFYNIQLSAYELVKACGDRNWEGESKLVVLDHHPWTERLVWDCHTCLEKQEAEARRKEEEFHRSQRQKEAEEARTAEAMRLSKEERARALVLAATPADELKRKRDEEHERGVAELPYRTTFTKPVANKYLTGELYVCYNPIKACNVMYLNNKLTNHSIKFFVYDSNREFFHTNFHKQTVTVKLDRFTLGNDGFAISRPNRSSFMLGPDLPPSVVAS